MENNPHPTEWVEITCASSLREVADSAFGFNQTRVNEPAQEVTGIIYGNPDALTQRLTYAATAAGGRLFWDNPAGGMSARFVSDQDTPNLQQ